MEKIKTFVFVDDINLSVLCISVVALTCFQPGIFLKFLIFLFFSSSAFACSLLQVPIGTPVSVAQGTFEFLEGHNNNNYGLNLSARYLDSAIDYCEGSQLENADLEVIIHNLSLIHI